MGLNNSWAGQHEKTVDKVEDAAVHTLVAVGIVCAVPFMIAAIAASALSDLIRGDSRKPHSPDDGL